MRHEGQLLQTYKGLHKEIILILQIFLFLSYYIWSYSFEKYHEAEFGRYYELC